MDTQLLIRKAQEGDKVAREQVINENVGLVWSIVRRFLGRGQEAEDLFQIGVIGLMKAVDKFDLSFEALDHIPFHFSGTLIYFCTSKVFQLAPEIQLQLFSCTSHTL